MLFYDRLFDIAPQTICGLVCAPILAATITQMLARNQRRGKPLLARYFVML
jgi:hypothetical protein